jgi:hypothetical protein
MLEEVIKGIKEQFQDPINEVHPPLFNPKKFSKLKNLKILKKLKKI